MEAKRTSVKEARLSRLTKTPAAIMGPRLAFIAAVVLLCGFGLVMVYSSSSILGLSSAKYDYDPTYFLKRQAIFLVAGVALCAIVAKIPYRFWGNPVVVCVLWVGSCIALAMTAFGMGVSALGAERSIMIGPFALQPAEFAKITVLLSVAGLFEMQRTRQWHPVVFAVIIGVAVIVPLLLIYRQPDLGTAIILLVGVLAMFIVVGVPWQAIALIFGAGALYIVYALLTQDYHMDRIITMFDPWADPQGDGYQSIQSFYALGSGGIFGTGLGLSHQKYLYLPYAHTDFIFAVIGEELGLVGTLFTVALYAVFVISGLRIMRNASDPYGVSLVGAFVTMVGFQAVVNMACVSGIAPVTGKALPFISYGGSSLVASLIVAGLVLSVSLRSRLDAEHERRRDDLVVVEGGKRKAAVNAPGLRERMAGAGISLVQGGKQVATPARGQRHQPRSQAGSGSSQRSAGRSGGTQARSTRRQTQQRGQGRRQAATTRNTQRGAATTRGRRQPTGRGQAARGRTYTDQELRSGRVGNSNAFRAGGHYARRRFKR